MELNAQNLKKLVKQSDMFRYDWEQSRYFKDYPSTWWGVEMMLDSIDKQYCIDYILGNKTTSDGRGYNMNRGVWFYRLNRNNFVLIAVVNKQGIKFYDKAAKERMKRL